MTSFRLYIDRLKQERQYQWKNTKAVIDWTILVYIVLTLLFVAAMVYDMFPSLIAILQELPYGLSFFVIYYLAWSGTIRVFYQQADSYFFVHRKDLLNGLKKWGTIAGLGLNVVKGVLIAALSYLLMEAISPSTLPLVEWILFYLTLFLFITVLDKVIDLHWSGWKRKLITIALFLAIGFFAYLTVVESMWILAIVMLMGGFIVLLVIYLRAESFWVDMAHNEKIRQKYVGMIFYASEYVHVPRASDRTKPLFFRRSQRIIEDRRPHGALTELFFKYLLRNSRHIFSYLQMVGITIAAMAYLPLWMTFGLFMAFFFFLKEWLNIVYDELVGHPFLNMHKGKKLIQEHYQELVTRWLYYPAIGLVGFVLIMNTLFHFLMR
ncbi:ABC transporter permease [Sutcliffiella horikoshii]|uniref:ABC transporter permease n=1 Tax=Sutcliffiella horikoshii TaxID=79883 RepID=UPI00203C0428|nr:ABC transporter permease [Sutcliffiella horikoshii]MCM3619519.1 ABC transporter permease [Sutcliffiella horikoshii]